MSAADIFSMELFGVESKDIEAAFEAARVRRSRALRLVIPAHHRLSAAFAQHVIDEIARTPTLQQLVIRHSGLVTRFIVSTIVLAAPDVKVTAEIADATREGERRLPERAPAIIVAEAPTLRWYVAELDPAKQTVAEVFAHAQAIGARALVLILRVDRPLDSDLRDALTDRLGRAKWLKALALVHSGAAVGFLASTLSLRASHVRIRSFPTVEEAEAMMRGL